MVAIISGALGDIGRSIARALARDGNDVALGDLHPSDDGLADELSATGHQSRYDQVDVTDGPSVRAWVDAVAANFGPPELVIPNAGTVAAGGVRDLDDSSWNNQLAVNLTGAFHLAQAGAKHLVDSGTRGRIVVVGSWAAHAPHPNITAYCVAKAGLRMLCKCLALELAPHGILVNEVAPGYVDAGLSKRLWDETPGARDAATAHVPTGELLTADDVARYVALLCGPTTAGMTGATLLVDGGLSLLAERKL